MVHLLIIFIGIIIAFEFESSTDDVIDDLKQTLEQNRKWHISNWVYLGIMSSLIAYGYNSWVLFKDSCTFWLVLIYIMCARILYFNLRLNIKNGNPLLYLGENGWDGIFYKIPKIYYTTFLGIGLLTMYLLWRMI